MPAKSSGRAVGNARAENARVENAKPKSKKTLLGRIGEEIAVRYLQALGWRILRRNLRFGRSPEIDIVARAPCGTTVFIEVRSCNKIPGDESWFETPCQSVNTRKQSRIARAARLFILSEQLKSDGCKNKVLEPSYRFDLIFIGLSREVFTQFENQNSEPCEGGWTSHIDRLVKEFLLHENNSNELAVIHCETAFMPLHHI